jgi:hypothetical protein
VDVKVPAKHQLDLAQKRVAVFSTLNQKNDSLIMVNLSGGLASKLEKGLELVESTIPVYNIRTDSNTIFDRGYIFSLAQQSNSEVIIIVEGLKVGKAEKVKLTSLQKETSYNASYFFVPLISNLTVYDGITAEKMATISQTDTVYWEIYSRNELRESLFLPKVYGSLVSASKEVGENLAKNFVDQWETVQKYIYVYNKEKWLKAYDYTLDFKWEEAMKIWLKEVESGDKLSSACAAFNLSVACEINGKEELAAEWVKYVKSCYPESGADNNKSIQR